MAEKTTLLIGNDLLRKKLGRAIAGPQIGYHKRIIFVDTGDTRIVMINPHITEKSQKTFKVWDSCFSAELAFFGKTLHHRAITVEYENERGEHIQMEFRDDLSELFQHEIDHLEGILFTDRIIDNQIIMRSE